MSRFNADDIAALDSAWNRRASIENPNVPISAATIEDLWGDGLHTPAGANVSPTTAMQMDVVFSCIRVIAETIAALPWQVFEQTDGQNTLAREHPLYPVLHDAPNRSLTSFVWRQTWVANAMLYGDAYALIESGGQSLLLLPSSIVKPTMLPRGLVYRVRYNDAAVDYDADQILHLPGLSLDGLSSLSVALYAARNVIGEAIAVQEHSSRFFSNGARPGGVLTTDQVLKEEAAARLRDQWQRMQGGLANAYKTAVLEQGVKYQPIVMQSDHAQLIETRRLTTERVAAAFRVPPMFVGDYSRMTYANAEHNDLHFAKHCIAPWLSKIEQEVNRKLFSGTRFFCEFNLAGLLRGDFRTQIDGFARGIQSAIYTPNEVRAKFNLPPVEGGDKLYIQQNMASVDALENQLTGPGDQGGSAAPSSDTSEE